MKRPTRLPRPDSYDNLDRWLRANRRAIQGQMMTYVSKLYYHPDLSLGVAVFPAVCCCDMSGAIAVFQVIDPDVQQIQTWSGDKADVIYTRAGRSWSAGFLKSQ